MNSDDLGKMAYVPQNRPMPNVGKNVHHNITVHALRENKRPIGFASWPEEELEKSQSREKKRWKLR